MVSDGGQVNGQLNPLSGQPYGYTEDIIIRGGSITNKLSSSLYPSAVICAFTFDGANVRNVSIMNTGVDASQVVAQLVNRSGTGTASLANGLTVMYGNNAGRINLIDSSRGIAGASI